MGKAEIIKYLIRTNNHPVTLIKLSRKLKTNKTNIARACRKLEVENDINVRRVKQGPYIRFLITLK